jgi:hypothetical protein
MKMSRRPALDSAIKVCRESRRHFDGPFFQEQTPMSGPIVRTGTTPKFWQNWDQVFGNKSSKKSASTTTKAKSTKGAKKASTKSAAGKKAKRPAGKKK